MTAPTTAASVLRFVQAARLGQRVRASLALVGVLVGLLLFIVVVAAPEWRRVHGYRAQAAGTQAKIDGVLRTIGAGDLQTGVTNLRRDLEAGKHALPDRVDLTVLAQTVGESARQHRVEIISIRPGGAEPVLLGPDQPLLLEGKPCERLQITVQGLGSFQAWGQYLEELQARVPHAVVVDSLRLTRDEDSAALNGQVVVSVYFLGVAEEP